MALSPTRDETILTVGQLTRRVKESIETQFPALWVRGEMSNAKRYDSGHLYFALKEGKDALLECVMFRTEAMRLGFEPKDGIEVEAFGGLSVYEPRGRYQLTVRELRPAGLGRLLLELEKLKRKLQAEGLFEAARKRPLPRYPARIGIVTSPTGAAVRDLVKVLRARWPGVVLVLAPVRVQGPGAAVDISTAIDRFNALRNVDLLIVGRGGGSLEDLWAFNEEITVRAVVRSKVPVIAAVGHEVDWTLTDFAADVRAATPSNAGEIAVPDRREVLRHVSVLREHARRAIRETLESRRRRLLALTEKYGFRRQRDALGPLRQRIDELTERIGGATRAMLERARHRVRHAAQRYGLREWPRELLMRREEIGAGRSRLDAALARLLAERRRQRDGCADRLRALSPHAVLDRGFCIARHGDGSLVRSALALTTGELLSVEFARGEADARVEALRPRGRNGSEENGPGA